MSSTPDALRLNLGSGPSGIAGWLNYDWGILPMLSRFPLIRQWLIQAGLLPSVYQEEWPPIELVDLRKRFPLPDQSVECIYSSHVLEHFALSEGLHILKESRRVLRPGGLIRLVVPDINRLYELYLKSGATVESARQLNLMWWGHSTETAPSHFISRCRRFFIRPHQWMYHSESLKHILQEAGFHSIQVCSFRVGELPQLDMLDLPSHEPYSLYMEARA